MIRDKKIDNSPGNIKENLHLDNTEGRKFLLLSHIRSDDKH